MINGNIFIQAVKNDIRSYKNIYQIAIDQKDDYTTGCLLDYNYFKDYYNMIVIDLGNQQALDPDAKAIRQIAVNPDRAGQTSMCFVIQESIKTILSFSQRTMRVLRFYFFEYDISIKLLNITLSM